MPWQTRRGKNYPSPRRERRADARAREDLIGAGRARGRGLARELGSRAHQRELGEAHRAHRACGRADVAGMGGLDEHDADGDLHGSGTLVQRGQLANALGREEWINGSHAAVVATVLEILRDNLRNAVHLGVGPKVRVEP